MNKVQLAVLAALALVLSAISLSLTPANAAPADHAWEASEKPKI